MTARRPLAIPCGYCSYRCSRWLALLGHVQDKHEAVAALIPSEEARAQEREANSVKPVILARASHPWNHEGYSFWGNPA